MCILGKSKCNKKYTGIKDKVKTNLDRDLLLDIRRLLNILST